ncbi:MAG: hypothetical protein SNJ68_08470 [Cyanobacteriota bacterium]
MSDRTGPLTSFAWRWCLASGLGGAVAGWLEGSGWQFSATLLLLGFTVGLAQSLCRVGFRSPVGFPQVVGSHPRLGWRWAVITGIGWILTGWVRLGMQPGLTLVIEALSQGFGFEVLWLNLVQEGVQGLGLSLLQWGFYLRQWPVPFLGWVGVNLLAGSLRGGISAYACGLLCAGSALGSGGSTAVVYGLGWLAYGGITGFWLARWVWRDPSGQASD